ncbi:carotenoid oxygenase family protein [Streptomyces avidinii]|uniref:Dioxygenase n=1 Tax=Streptomyces avidinii TaxID=1895 RepID=A0ABS4KYZ6_STRAV|nr:carotenoid oxygenase family protein [Streptomyces avidinii]MBP2035228.1 carotenoid cleavage dioxygenase [Streptomyces avidinii]GGZ03962.1 carotenoid cleavage dioxygenase [Streptomyces avidinii]
MTTNAPFLTGHYTPAVDEITATELTVEGSLPPELTGRLIRNSHNPKAGVTPTHWFKGSGMVHGIRLREGRAEWYRNRWVHTPALDGAPYLTEHGPDLTASTAGTHVIEHAGRLLALCEANLPFELTPELETVGAHDFDGRLRGAMTAHPKTDPITGELHFFGSSPLPPHLMYYVADANGRITHSAEVPGATAALKHDFAITRHHVVFIEGTVTFDPTEHSGIPYGWNDEQPARIGVMPRGPRGAGLIRWFPIEPGSMLHAANAYEDARGRIVLEGPTVDREGFRLSWNWWVGAPGRGTEPNARSYNRRWVIDLAADSVAEQITDDLAIEFPTLNEEFLGSEHRYQYAISFPDQEGQGGYGIVKYDRTTGARDIHEAGDARLPSEAVFVPAAGATREDDGYLLTVVSDLKQDSSQLLVLDASGLDRIATVHLPRRVTAGIHGSWIPDSDLGGSDH